MHVLYFAWVREKAGLAAEEVTPPDNVTDVAALISWLRARGGGRPGRWPICHYCGSPSITNTRVSISR